MFNHHQSNTQPKQQDHELSGLKPDSYSPISWKEQFLGSGDISQDLNNALNLILPAPFPMAIFWGTEHRFFCNHAFGSLIKAADKYQQLQGSQELEFWPGAWQVFAPMVASVMNGGAPVLEENYPFQTLGEKDTVHLFLTFSCSPILSNEGCPAGVLLSCRNNTQQHLKAPASGQAENQLRDLVMHAPVGMAVIREKDHRLTLVNKAFLPLLGNTSEALLQQPLFVVWAQAKNILEPVLDNAISTGLPQMVKSFAVHRENDGQNGTRWFDLAVEPLPNHEGNTINSCLLVAIETTTEVLNRKQLIQTKEVLELTMENVPASIFLLQASGDLIFCNQKLVKDLHNRVPGLEGKPLSLHEAYREYIKTISFQDETGRELSYEELPCCQSMQTGVMDVKLIRKVTRSTGAVSWSEIKATPLLDHAGKTSMVLVTDTDITEQKAANQALQESEERFRSTFKNAAVGIAHVSTGGDFTMVNEQFCDILGYTREELLTQGFQEITFPEDLQADLNLVKQLLDGKGSTFTLEKRYLHKNGSIVWASLTVALVRNKEGEPQYFISVIHDISKSKQAEKKLQESEEQLRIALEGGELGYFNCNLESGRLHLSDRTCNLFGITPQDHLTYHQFLEKLHPEDLENFRGVMNGAIAGANAGRYEFEFRAAGEEEAKFRWIKSTGRVAFDESGIPLRLSGVVQDITDQKHMDAQIKESEQRFRNLAAHAPMWVWMMDQEINLTYSNQQLLNFLGIQHYSEFLGRAWEKVIHPEDTAHIYEEVAHAVQHILPCSVEARIRNGATGEYEWFYLKVAPRFEQEAFVGFVGIGINIQENKLRLEALQQSEEQFRSLTEALPQLIWMTDAAGNHLYSSSNWYQYTGVQEKYLEGWVKMVHPEDWETTMSLWQENRTRKSPHRIELRLKTKEGAYRWNVSHGAPIKNEQGEVVKWIGTLTDIHDQKTFADQLEQLVDQRTHELRRSNEDLQQFAHVASHDLKEPVRKIKTFVSRLEMELQGKTGDKAIAYLAKVQNAANRMMTMIDGVLNYSTLNASEQIFEPVCLQETIQQIEADLELVIQQKGACIRYGQLPAVTAAPVLIYQLFYNLIYNSLKFSREGVPPEIDIQANIAERSSKPIALISISDNGIGFDNQYADQIFGTFTRLHSKDKYEGTGLGLALCRKIVERHGGTIEASGKPGVGATIKIGLPLEENRM